MSAVTFTAPRALFADPGARQGPHGPDLFKFSSCVVGGKGDLNVTMMFVTMV
jgi:hypothetical protein